MANTQQLIRSLSQEAKPARLMQGPITLSLKLAAVLLTYALALGFVLEFREDLAVQLSRPMYLAEMVALFMVFLTTLVAAVHLSYPDYYQKQLILPVPILSMAALAALLLLQGTMPTDPLMVLTGEHAHHTYECTICIAASSIIPAAVLFMVVHRGATVRPRLAGGFVVLSAAAVGCLMLRLAEANDSLTHLLVWHYVPTVLFAGLGVVLGKRLLKW